jgi:hypothetical protein
VNFYNVTFFATLLASLPAMADEAAEAAEAAKAKLSTTIDLVKGKQSWIDKLTLTPRVLQASDANASPSLGLGYTFKAKPVLNDLTGDAAPGQPIPATKQFAFELEASGLYAAKVEANQSKLVDFSSSGSWLWVGDLGVAGTVFSKSAFGAGYSRMQGGGQRESRWEVSQGLGKIFPRLNYTQVLSRVALANVLPKVDAARQAVTGSDLHDYRRWEAELVLIAPVQRGMIQKIELNHREFREVSAASAVKSAGLDRFKLSSVYFGLDKGLFVAFSRGGLPADRKSSRVLQMGWSTNIE